MLFLNTNFGKWVQELSIVVVDMNMFHPDISSKIQKLEVGWNQWLKNPKSRPITTVCHPYFDNTFENLWLLPFLGEYKEDASQVLHLFSELKNHFDVIFLDMPSLDNSSLVYSLAKHVNGVFYVVETHKTRRQVIGNCIQKIKEAGGNLIGVILNKRKYTIPNIIYSKIYK